MPKSIEVTPSVITADVVPVEKTGPPADRNRKGLGAKRKQAEKFRSKKNEAFHEQMHEKNRQLRDSYSKFDNFDDFLASLKIGETVSHPPDLALVVQKLLP